MTYSVDNSLDYTTREPEGGYKEVQYDYVFCGGMQPTGDENDYCDPHHTIHLVKVKRTNGPCDLRDIKYLLTKAHTPSPCHCEHDCCGHWHGSATAIPDPHYPDQFFIHAGISRNY